MLSGSHDRRTCAYFPRKFLANKLAIASSLSTLRKTYKTRRRRRSTSRYTGERETRHHDDPIQRERRSREGGAEQEVSLLAFEVGGLRITWQPISNSFLRGISRMSRSVSYIHRAVSRTRGRCKYLKYLRDTFFKYRNKFFKTFRYFVVPKQHFLSFTFLRISIAFIL